jgi:hypothetical protein
MNAYAKQRGYQAQRLSWWRTRLGGEAWAGSGAPAETITLAPAVITGSVRPAVVVSVDATAVTMEVLDAAAVPASWVAQVALGLRSMGAA